MTRRSWARPALALLPAWATVACSAESTEPRPQPARLIADEGALRARVSTCLGGDVGGAVAVFGPQELGGASDETIACLASTIDCHEVLACFGWTRDSCIGDDSCEGSRAVHCRMLPNGIRVLTSNECADDEDGNRECAVVDDGKSVIARCSSGSCAGDRCEGNVRVHCFGGVEVKESCARRGRVCAMTEAGSSCVIAERCERPHCEGNTAVACLGEQVDLKIDCSQVVAGGRCKVDGCLAETWNPACPSGEPYTSFCDGNHAFACNVGALYEVRCADFLDGTCAPRTNGAGVRCRSPGWL